MPGANDQLSQEDKYRIIFDKFDSGNDGRLNAEEMSALLVALPTQDLTKAEADEQAELSMRLAEDYQFLADYFSADGISYEGFKMAYGEFSETGIDEDYFMLEAYGLL